MKQNGNFGFEKSIPDPKEIKQLNAIEDDSDTLEPFDDSAEHREVNADDPKELSYWADEFQISVHDLKAAIVMNGTSVRELKKYLSV